MNKKIDKISYANGLQMVTDGYISKSDLDEMIRTGKVAGQREIDSFRLKGVRETITVSFPTPSVRLPKGKSLKDLDTQDREVVENWKAALSDAFRPVYNNLRDQHTEKIAVKY